MDVAQTTEQRDRPSLGTLLLRIALAAAAVAAVWALADVLLLVFLAILFAAVLRGAAEWLAERMRMPVQLMLGVTTVAVILGFTGLSYWIGPRLLQQGHELITSLSQLIGQLRDWLDHSGWGRPIGRALSDTQVAGQQLVGPAETALRVTLRTLSYVVILVVTSFYLAINPSLYLEGVIALVPLRNRARVREVMGQIGHALRLWFAGQLIDMVTVGILAAAGLDYLGVPEAYALGALAGLLTFIPYFGAVLAAVPGVAIALTIGWPTALWAVAVYVACHFVEGYVVAPLVQRKLIELPPALTIVSMTIMGTLFGPLGILVGTPLAAVLLIAVREFYVRDALGNCGPDPNKPETKIGPIRS